LWPWPRIRGSCAVASCHWRMALSSGGALMHLAAVLSEPGPKSGSRSMESSAQEATDSDSGWDQWDVVTDPYYQLPI
jgi:hypothetical protein